MSEINSKSSPHLHQSNKMVSIEMFSRTPFALINCCRLACLILLCLCTDFSCAHHCHSSVRFIRQTTHLSPCAFPDKIIRGRSFSGYIYVSSYTHAFLQLISTRRCLSQSFFFALDQIQSIAYGSTKY